MKPTTAVHAQLAVDHGQSNELEQMQEPPEK
jgi:hypothetical protein